MIRYNFAFWPKRERKTKHSYKTRLVLSGEPLRFREGVGRGRGAAAAHSAIIQGGMMQLIHLTMYDYVSGIKSKVSSTGFEIFVKKLEILAGNLNF